MKIDSDKLVDVTYTLDWQSPVARHSDRFFGHAVNMWRDCFPERVYRALEGRSGGDRVVFEFGPGDLLPGYTQDRVMTLKRRQFGGRDRTTADINPMPGRFYPKGLLKDLAGIFPNNVEPFRCLSADDDTVTADFNHPLAGISLTLTADIQKVSRKEKERGGSCTDWIETITDGPGMQAHGEGCRTVFATNGAFSRQDESSDDLFYRKPRLVNHIDDHARAVVQDIYAAYLKSGMRVLDLMAGWASHIPTGIDLEGLVGLGMNKNEMEANPAISETIVRDLNHRPEIPFADGVFDAVICTVSIEYLTNPSAVFAEAARVLKPGGAFVITFSNRWFPPKVIRLWTELHEFERIGFVIDLFEQTSDFGDVRTVSVRGLPRPTSDKYYPERRLSDPVYTVSARKRIVAA